MSISRAVELLCAETGLPEPPAWRAFGALVESWSSRTDLTAARSSTELAEILFLDAAQLIRAGWLRPSARLVDVGAGVGAPTIPLLLVDQTLRATLIEPRRLRAAFLRTACGTLDIVSRVEVRQERIDPALPEVPGAPFDVSLSRATFEPGAWLQIGLRLAKETWLFTAGKKAPAPAHLSLEREVAYEVPSSGAPRAILAYRAASGVP